MGESCGRTHVFPMTADARKLIKGAKGADLDGEPMRSAQAHTVRVFVDSLERLGYDVDSLLANAGVRRPDLADPDARIACPVLPQVIGAAMQQKPLKNLGARLAVETPIGAFPLVDYLVITSETVGAALRQLARYLRLNEAPFALDPRGDEDPIRVMYERALNAFAVEFGVVLTLLHLREETQGQLNVIPVSFTHTPDDAAEIEHLLGCPVHASASWNGFLLPREAWEMTMRRRDPVLRSVLEQHAAALAARVPETNMLARDVRRVLASRMSEGETQIESVARALATSTRSLQRRLAAVGLSYQQLLENARREAADEYLSDPSLSIGEVAYLLGYSEPAAFHRAFKRWNGMTPQASRDHQRRRSRPERKIPEMEVDTLHNRE